MHAQLMAADPLSIAIDSASRRVASAQLYVKGCQPWNMRHSFLSSVQSATSLSH